jgi:hypothetical protein
MSVTTQSIKTAAEAFCEAAKNKALRATAMYMVAMTERPIRTTVATQFVTLATCALMPGKMGWFTTALALAAGGIYAKLGHTLGQGYTEEPDRTNLRDLASGRATAAEISARVQAARNANTP